MPSSSYTVECDNLHPFEIEFKPPSDTGVGIVSLYFYGTEHGLEEKNKLEGVLTAVRRIASSESDNGVSMKIKPGDEVITIETNDLPTVWAILADQLNPLVVDAVRADGELAASNILDHGVPAKRVVNNRGHAKLPQGNGSVSSAEDCKPGDSSSRQSRDVSFK